MKSVKNITQSTLAIKKSQFITTLIPCNDPSQINQLIQKYRADDATHNCVAYIVGGSIKADDDGEPSGTAGLPMLNVLERQELSNIIVIVTRYFGGIKLGAGGLTRAYSNAVVQALDEAEIVEKTLVKKYQIALDYHFTKKAEYLMRIMDVELMNTTYDEKAHYTLYIKDPDFIEQLKELTSNQFYCQVIGEDYI